MFNLPEPRKWQKKAFQIWKKSNNGVAKVVTGGGKTAFAGMCIRRFLSKKDDGRVVIVVPTNALQDQWAATMIANWGVEEKLIATNRDEVHNFNWRYLILVINTAREINPNLSHEKDLMLVVDECHRAGSNVNRNCLIGDWSATLGLSATPERQYDDYFESVIVPSLGPIIIDYDYSMAAKDGVIAGFGLSNHKVEFIEEEQNEYDSLTRKISVEFSRLKKEGVTSSERLEKLLIRRASISKNAELRLPVAVALVQSVLPRKTILFHESILHIEAISHVLQEYGIDCRTYHSKLSKRRKIESLALFIEGSIEVLLTCRSLDEGFDLPDIEVGIIASMTKSPRQRIQRLGRILRRSGSKIAEIKTIHTLHEEEMLEKEAEELHEAISINWFG